jgi:predicted permease
MDKELDDELRNHIDLLVAAKIRTGMTEAEARREARLEFGGLDQIKEDCRESRGTMAVVSLLQDIRFAARQLLKNPGFALITVFTLALGIGANISIFSVLEGILFKALPYPNPERLVSVELSPLALDPSLRGMAPEDYFVFRDQSHTFQDIGIYAETDSDRDVNVTGVTEPERVHALGVTYGVLSSLGVPAIYGRIFSRADDSPGAPLTAVLTYSYWQRNFGADPSIVGRNITIDGKTRQIIGVLPREFRFFETPDLAVILPLQLDSTRVHQGNFSYFGIGRLRTGVTLRQASADLERMLPIVFDSFPPTPGISIDSLRKARMSPNLLVLKEDVVGNIGSALWVLMGGIGLVFLIACANVANLLLVRTDSRQHELALRAALGASRRRIAVLLLCESVIIGLLGTIVGLALAFAGLRFLIAFAPQGLPRISDIGINLPVLVFTLAVALFSSLLFGLIQVVKFANISAFLSPSNRTLTPSRERYRVRNFFVIVQVALAVVLLVFSGLMIRTFRALTRVNPGFASPSELQTFRIAIPPSAVADDRTVVRAEQQIQSKIAAVQGASAVAFSSAVPLQGDHRLDNVFAADHRYAEGALPPLRHLLFISPGFFQTLGIPFRAGRDITWTETFNRVPVALVSENLARELWHTPAQALGKHIRISTVDDWREIIGVVGDVHDESLDKPAQADVYWPVLRANFQGRDSQVSRYVTFTVRSPRAGSEKFMNEIRQAIWSVDANLPLASVHTLDYFYEKSMARTSFTLAMLVIAGAMALLLGTIGLYGVIAYSAAQRTREIGIRIALGSNRSDVVKLVLREGMPVIALGLGIGLLASLGSTRLLSSLLFRVPATDPLTFGGVAFLLAVIAVFACYIPARRASRVDPMVALRYE